MGEEWEPPTDRPTVDDATRQEVENPSEPAAHRVILARFDSGWADWRLECLHDLIDWHVYCDECTNPDCCDAYHHDQCVLRTWWDEEHIELVADTTGPITVPFDVDVSWSAGVPKLAPRKAR